MGRRSRQRASTPAAPRRAAGAPPAARADAAGQPALRAPSARRRRRDEAPPPPWGAFPLAELCALAAIAVGVWGILGGDGALLTTAALLGSVAGLEVAIREHLGGFRSHTLVLSGALAVATLAVLFYAHVDRTTMLPIGAAVFALAVLAFGTLFKRRSGGYRFRIR